MAQLQLKKADRHLQKAFLLDPSIKTQADSTVEFLPPKPGAVFSTVVEPAKPLVFVDSTSKGKITSRPLDNGNIEVECNCPECEPTKVVTIEKPGAIRYVPDPTQQEKIKKLRAQKVALIASLVGVIAIGFIIIRFKIL